MLGWRDWEAADASREVRLSIADIARLLELVSNLTEEGDTTPGEVIERLEKMLCPCADRHERRRAELAEFVARLRAVRMRRNEIVGAPLFRDPAWDMLLELFVAYQNGRPVSVTSLCYASGVPPTTALRHLSRMEEHGLITRDGDATDNRRWLVHPTEKALAGIGRAAAMLMGHTEAAQAANEDGHKAAGAVPALPRSD